MARIQNEFSWSNSRDHIFRECKRKYYYNYYGSWGGWEKDSADEVTRGLYVLKNLQNRWQWKGSVVHNEIAMVLRELTTTRRLVDYELSEKRLSSSMREGFRESRTGGYWEKSGGLRDHTALFEHEYKLDIPDGDWKKNYDEAVLCLENFFKSSVVDKLSDNNNIHIVTVDSIKPTSFDFRGDMIYVNLDFAYSEDDVLNIVDWKTGSTESEEMQFLVYCIYGERVLGYPLDKIELLEYNLLLDSAIPHSYNEADIKEAEVSIERSIRGMKSYLTDVDTNLAQMARFPKTEDQDRCNSCNFKNICLDLP